MKILKFLVLAIFVASLGKDLQAQSRFGKDSIECITNLNLYNGEFKRKDYKAALPYWREAIKYCPPTASHNLYIAGSTMMRAEIAATKDPALRKARIDTLMMMYDIRMKNYKVDLTDLLTRKAADYESYYPNDKEHIYDDYLAAVDANKEKADLFAAAKAMMAAKELYEQGKFDSEKFTNIYTNLCDVAEGQCKHNPEDTVRAAYKMAIESAFLSTDAANCDNLVKVFGERFKGHEEDVEVVRLVVGQLGARECTQNDLYYQAVEAYNRLNPSPAASYGLAKMYYAKGDKEKANEYFRNAIDTETDPHEKSRFLQEVGGLAMKEGSINSAISYARQAINANPRNGKAFLLLGTAYAGLKNCGSEDDEVSKRAMYWIAVDQFVKAKQVDPSLAEDANKSINLYSQYFPSQVDAFHLDILDGQTYNVNCGSVNEKTIVRTRK